jgi:signal transduction histidine kinase
MIDQQKTQEQLASISEHLITRRTAILDAWRSRVNSDPELTTGSALSRTLFNDHIPDILDSFARRLRSWPDEISMEVQEQENVGMTAHGLHRWQQGFRLRELTREWGYLQLCLVDEMETFAHERPELYPVAIATALRSLTHLCVAGVSDSADQYWQLEQAEAAGRLRDLEQALAAVNEIESARAAGWHQAAHDLRGGVSVVAMATSLLNDGKVEESDRLKSAALLQRSVSSLHEMFNHLIDLARLEAGHEQRHVEPFDAAILLSNISLIMQPVAQGHGLFLKAEGPPSLPVEGDRLKVQRILQNLVLNALKYTHEGGVVITWQSSNECETERWMVSVQDTGPGLSGDAHSPLTDRLHEATLGAQQVEKNAEDSGTSAKHDEPAATLVSQSSLPVQTLPSPLRRQAGEGIGLSIVKGLCGLLDATLEVETSHGQGTTFRVTFPSSYPA